jgi:Putative phage serine protease XkdF
MQSEITITTEIIKAESQHLIYGVVLEPGLTDSQGDTVTPDEIQKAAHRFLIDSRRHDIQHAEQQSAVDTVESYIAPCDLVIEGEPVQKGAWVQVLKVNDPAIWHRVQSGELTGLSMGGSATRV